MISKQTSLDLNGPILSFIQQPSSIGVCNGGSATFIGIATASFPVQTPPNPTTNTGTLIYQWYAEGFGPLTDGQFQGVTISGTGTTTLTVSNVSSPSSSGLKFYVGVDYIPSAYSQPVGSAVTVGTGRSTGNALNEILNSNTATLTVFPVLSIAQQPSSQTVSQNIPATFTTLGTVTDTSQGEISYRWILNGNDLSDSSTVTGSGTTTLSISLPNISNNTIRARLSHPTSCSAPIFTNTVNFNVVDPRLIINYEIDNNNVFPNPSFGSVNLSDGPLTYIGFPGANGGPIGYYFYASERDIEVKITLAGSAGRNKGSFRGGQGGLSSFRLLMRRNVEYVVRIGATDVMFANGGGGGAVYLHEQSRIIAICGGGGGAGELGNGGDGGGVNVAGANGSGRGAGIGGYLIAPGTLPARGFLNGGSLDPYSSGWTFVRTGGRASGCPYGSNWVNAGFSPCQNYFGQARNFSAVVSGTFFTRTAAINRGFKPSEWGYRINGGNAFGRDGGGGNGTIGGDGAQSGSQAGGGGASGYHDGSIQVISTQLGGNASERGFITIERI